MREPTILMPILLLLSILGVCAPALAQTPVGEGRPPIIDMHLHAFRLTDGRPPPDNPVTGRPSAAATTAELRDASLAALARYNIVKAVTSGPAATVAQWRAAAPDRVLAAHSWTRRTRCRNWQRCAPTFERGGYMSSANWACSTGAWRQTTLGWSRIMRWPKS